MMLHTEKRIALLVFSTLLIVAALSILSYWSFHRLIGTSKMLSQTTAILSKTEEILKSVVEVETGPRGYIITGNEIYLEPYYISQNNIPIYLNELDSLTAHNALQQQHIVEMRRLIEKRLAWSKQLIAARKSSFEKAKELVLLGEGNNLTNEIRALINLIKEDERATFEVKNANSINSLQLFQYSFIGLTLSVLVIVIVLFSSISAAFKARNKIQLQLVKNAGEIHDLYDHAPCGYHSVNTDDFFVNMNQTELNWLGYTKEELIGKLNFTDLLTEESKAKYSSNFQEFKEKGSVNNIELEFVRKNGSTFPVIVNSVTVLGKYGEFIKSRSTVFDNTLRKQTEELLRANEERYRSIVTSVNDAIVIMDENGNVINWNTGAETIFGWTEQEIQGESLTKVIPEKYREAHIRGLERFRASKKSSLIGKTIELEGLRKNQTIFPLELSIGTWQKEEHIYYCGILRDITERKENEKRISEMASIVEFSQDAIISLSLDGTITSWNKGAENLYGHTFEEANSKSFTSFIPNELQTQEARIFSRVRAGEFIRQYESQRVRKDGSVMDVSLTISPIKDKNGTTVGISEIVHDITDRKKKENKIQQLNKELDAFTYSVSHDLRAPLRSIAGYAQILLEDYGPKLDDEGKRVTNVVIKNAKRMGLLIDDLLDFARLSKKELSIGSVDMNQVVNQILEEFKEVNTKIDFEVDSLLPAVADNTMITQVWINLISNAIKYSSNNDRIKIHISSMKQDQEICYLVRDNGVGFDMSYSGKLFGVFQRLHKITEFEGTGVGLAIVKRIVTRHRGRVWAEGEVNKGATFYFSLPNKLTRTTINE